jgi:hypothetical protein
MISRSTLHGSRTLVRVTSLARVRTPRCSRTAHAIIFGATACGAVVAAAACAPRIQPMPGVAPATITLPPLTVAPTPQRVTFRWELNDGDMVARGDGVARIAPPDSVRVDLFLGGGFGRAAAAILIGDSVRVPPGGESEAGLLPPPPLMWAAFGRLAVPPLADTVVRVSGDTIRAELGHPPRWRLAAARDQLLRLERISGDRIVEWVQRTPGREVRYELSGRRSLVLHVDAQQPSAPFDASVWHF